HLEAGAGVVGLIKAALALHHRRIPGNLHFDRPNPEIDFEGLRLRVPTRCEPWPDGEGPILAGVHAFGVGGTNARVVLQEGEGLQRVVPRSEVVPIGGRSPLLQESDRRAWLVSLSARGPEALREMARSWEGFLARCPDDVSLDDVAWNAALRRTHHDHRLA